MEHKKSGLIAMSILAGTFVLAGCGRPTPPNGGTPPERQPDMQFSGERPIPPVQIQQSDSSGSSDTLGQAATVNKTVAISNACIGCGKCTRIASNTFSMNGHKATVVSQDYASSSAVQQAASNCPVSAISVNEG